MKNIQKIAEDIFKAPTRAELAERVEFLTKNELIALLKEDFEVPQPLLDLVLSLFPKGVQRSNSLVFPWKFNIIKKKIESQVHRWQLLGTVQTESFTEEEDKSDFFKAQLKNGTNVLKIVHDMGEGVEVLSYLFEKL